MFDLLIRQMTGNSFTCARFPQIYYKPAGVHRHHSSFIFLQLNKGKTLKSRLHHGGPIITSLNLVIMSDISLRFKNQNNIASPCNISKTCYCFSQASEFSFSTGKAGHVAIYHSFFLGIKWQDNLQKGNRSVWETCL